ncbi:hypothetical protein JHK85_010193 [Glycine max]|nr:hypothetical protein JHK85_010193 [Glycine max]
METSGLALAASIACITSILKDAFKIFVLLLYTLASFDGDEATKILTQFASFFLGQNAEKEEEKMVEKGLVRFGDLQTMRRVRTRKRLMMKKMQMAIVKEAEKSILVSLVGGAQPLPHSIYNSLKTFANPSRDVITANNESRKRNRKT